MSVLRLTKVESATIANGAAVSGAIDVSRYSGMQVFMPAAWTAANIGFAVCATEDGTFVQLNDKTDAIVEIASPAVDLAYAAPVEIFPSMFLKLWSQDGAGSDTNQAAARTLTVVLKS
jgi:hypothetical protein